MGNGVAHVEPPELREDGDQGLGEVRAEEASPAPDHNRDADAKSAPIIPPDELPTQRSVAPGHR